MARKTTKPTTRPASKTSRKRTKTSQPVNYEIRAIVIVALSLLIGLSFFTKAIDPVGSAVRTVVLGCLGKPGYLLCFILFFSGVHFVIKHDLKKYKSKYWMTFVLVIAISCFWNVVTKNTNGNYWNLGTQGLGGGFIGGWISYPIFKLCNFWGSVIVFGALSLVLLVLIFEVSFVEVVKSIYGNISEKFKEDDEYYDEEEDKEEYAPSKKNIPPKMKKEYNEIKKKIFDFEKEFGELPDEPIKKVKEKLDKKINATEDGKQLNFDDSDVFEDVPTEEDKEKIEEVLATQNPDEDKIFEAIEVATEEALLPKKKKKDQPSPVEIEINNDAIDYNFPPISLLQEPEKPTEAVREALERTAKKLIDTLSSFGVDAKITDYSQGPTITRYELLPSAGVKISKITNLADDIALNLAVSHVRIEPISGKSAIGVEVPNEVLSAVYIREVLATKEFNNFKSKLAFSVGKDIAGNPVVGDIARMPHLLIAGSTGSGKSVCINTLITSILYKATPNEVKLVMVDPKVVELGVYNGIPHLLIPVVTDPRKAAGALQWAVNEMTNRYKLFADTNVRDLKGYNSWAKENDKEELPQIVIIIDELADLMMVAPNDVEDSICRLAQMARAAGMHLVIATQRPSVDVITGIIKANIPSRIAFAVSSFVDSKTILDMGGAEKLLGRGDMLYNPIGASKPLRVQGAFVTDKEVENIVNFVKKQNCGADYNQDVIEQIESAGEKPQAHEERGEEADELLPTAVEMAIDAGQASVAMYQRRLKIGYQRAARLIDQMESRKIIGPFDGTKPREVKITKAQWNEMFMNMNASDLDDGQTEIDSE